MGGQPNTNTEECLCSAEQEAFVDDVCSRINVNLHFVPAANEQSVVGRRGNLPPSHTAKDMWTNHIAVRRRVSISSGSQSMSPSFVGTSSP